MVVSEGLGIGENMKRKIIPIIIILAISTALLMAALRRVQMTRENKDGYTHISGRRLLNSLKMLKRMMLKLSMCEARLWGNGSYSKSIPVWYEAIRVK